MNKRLRAGIYATALTCASIFSAISMPAVAKSSDSGVSLVEVKTHYSYDEIMSIMENEGFKCEKSEYIVCDIMDMKVFIIARDVSPGGQYLTFISSVKSEKGFSLEKVNDMPFKTNDSFNSLDGIGSAKITLIDNKKNLLLGFIPSSASPKGGTSKEQIISSAIRIGLMANNINLRKAELEN